MIVATRQAPRNRYDDEATAISPEIHFSGNHFFWRLVSLKISDAQNARTGQKNAAAEAAAR